MNPTEKLCEAIDNHCVPVSDHSMGASSQNAAFGSDSVTHRHSYIHYIPLDLGTPMIMLGHPIFVFPKTLFVRMNELFFPRICTGGESARK